jgi:small-conductance mechanosensitive channel
MAFKITIQVTLSVLAAALILTNSFLYRNVYVERLAATFLILSITYFLFKIILEGMFVDKLTDYKNRYYYSKTISIVHLLLALSLILAIWVENVQALLVGFGLIAAAFTLTLQDVARNFVGGIAIFVNRIYYVGDRIEIKDKQGDVIDIGLLYTTLFELGNWVNGDQPTGRLSLIPNAYVLNNTVNNYTKDFEFIWDEIIIPVTYDSDWKEASSLILSSIREATKDIISQAKEAIPLLERKYFFSGRSTDPAVFVRLTDNWIELSARFVTDPLRRRIIRNVISQGILEGIRGSEKVDLASQTFDIVGFPEIRFRKMYEGRISEKLRPEKSEAEQNPLEGSEKE